MKIPKGYSPYFDSRSMDLFERCARLTTTNKLFLHIFRESYKDLRSFLCVKHVATRKRAKEIILRFHFPRGFGKFMAAFEAGKYKGVTLKEYIHKSERKSSPVAEGRQV